jgi:hypothetical protein
MKKSKSKSDGQSVSQSVSMSWRRAYSGTCDQILLAVGKLRSCFCGASSLMRGRVCSLQCNHSIVLVAQKPQPYFTVSSETPIYSNKLFSGTRAEPSSSARGYNTPGIGFPLHRRYSNQPPLGLTRKSSVFGDLTHLTPCSPLRVSRCFGTACRLHLHG